MIKDLIEEQKREARNRVSGVTFNVINDPQTKYWFTKEDLDDFLTEAMTLAYEAGGREERERIIAIIKSIRIDGEAPKLVKDTLNDWLLPEIKKNLLKAITPDQLNNEREV